jgi:hypothetical protein
MNSLLLVVAGAVYVSLIIAITRGGTKLISRLVPSFPSERPFSSGPGTGLPWIAMPISTALHKKVEVDAETPLPLGEADAPRSASPTGRSIKKRRVG